MATPDWQRLKRQLINSNLLPIDARILDLAANGNTQPSIASELGLHRSAVWRRLAKLKQLALDDVSAIYRFKMPESEAVTVDQNVCLRLARKIAALDVPWDHEETSLEGVPVSHVGNFFLFLVAICHQTSPLGKPRVQGYVNDRLLTGWDFLLHKLQQRVVDDVELLDFHRWVKMSEAEFTALFFDDRFGNLLVGNSERVQLINDLGSKLSRHSWALADQMFDYCEGRISTGDPNLIGVLGECVAYTDPVFKKSLFFLALMRNSGKWQYVDDECLGPPVDYHEIRGHLRIGTVKVLDPTLLAKITKQELISEAEDVEVRRAVFSAIWLISTRSGLRNPSRLHYFFWNIFRAVCVREEPYCSTHKVVPNLTERYSYSREADGLFHCPFEALCASAHQSHPIIEPSAITTFY
jgi:hypothetical protein